VRRKLTSDGQRERVVNSLADDFIKSLAGHDGSVVLCRQGKCQVAGSHVAAVVAVEDHLGGSVCKSNTSVLKKLLTNVLRTSYELLANFLWASYELLMNFLWTSYELLMNFLWTSYKLLTNFLQNSYKLLTNFLQLLTNVLQTYYKFLIKLLWTSNELLPNFKNFYKLPMDFMQLNFCKLFSKFLWAIYKLFMDFLQLVKDVL
jgi:hypothetical protein